MLKLLPISIGLVMGIFLNVLEAQVVSTIPVLPSKDQAVTVTFNASEGSAGLKDYTEDIYAHTGVITSKSTSESDWKYVKAEWTVNLDECKLKRVSDNTYQLTIAPSIREFYSIPDDEFIQKIALVFRNADGSLEGKDEGGKDILIDIFSNDLGVAFTKPNNRWLIVDMDSLVDFSISSNKKSFLNLAISDSSISISDTNQLDYKHSFTASGTYYAVASAIAENDTAYDTSIVCVKLPVIEEPMPQNFVNGINDLGSGNVGVVLQAPFKKHVFLLGDFNNWLPTTDYQLKKDGDKWWMILKNINAGEEYAYKFLIDGEFTIADPYTTKILDPWNDSYISNDVYPDLKKYPSNKADGIVSVMQTNKSAYFWQVKNPIVPETEKLVIYELLIRDFVESSAIKDVIEKLDYLQELGINAIELMPFNEFEGNSSWGYNPSFYFATDKYYGTETDYKTFIDECHKRGIAVFMDIVFNHAFGQCPLVQLYFDNEKGQPSAENPWFNTVSPNNVFSWGYDFNHEATATKEFIDRVIEFWMTEFKIDGFRFDFTKGFTNTPGDGQTYDVTRIDILKRFYNVIKGINENGILICEHLADNSEERILADYGIFLWGNMNYQFTEASMGYYRNANLSGASYQYRDWQNPNLIAYMESHDEERMMFKNLEYGDSIGIYNTKDEATALDRVELSAVFYFSIPGPKMIWQFGELGFDYSIDFNGRVGEKPVRWDYLDNEDRKDLYNTFALMAELKTGLPVFNTRNFTLDVGKTAVKTITLESPEQDIITIGNFGVSSTTAEIEFTQEGYWYELFSSDSVKITNTAHILSLEPGEYRLFSTSKLSNPFKKKPLNTDKNAQVKIYPNPVKTTLNINYAHLIDHVVIYSANGQIVKEYNGPLGSSGLDVSFLPKGLYLFKYAIDGKYEVQKFVRK